MLEEEYEAFTNMSMVLRRGRCNKIFAKYVQTCIFEDADTEDSDSASGDKKMLKKRKKKYQSVIEYLKD